MPFLLKIVWKTPVVAVAQRVGFLSATQAGWSSAELVVNAPLMGPIEDFVTGIMFTVGAAMTIGPLILVHRIAKPALYLMVPILVYSALVPGVEWFCR
jgi:hypothetical protein